MAERHVQTELHSPAFFSSPTAKPPSADDCQLCLVHLLYSSAKPFTLSPSLSLSPAVCDRPSPLQVYGSTSAHILRVARVFVSIPSCDLSRQTAGGTSQNASVADISANTPPVRESRPKRGKLRSSEAQNLLAARWPLTRPRPDHFSFTCLSPL